MGGTDQISSLAKVGVGVTAVGVGTVILSYLDHIDIYEQAM